MVIRIYKKLKKNIKSRTVLLILLSLTFKGPCSNVSCENNGTCIEFGISAICGCPPGFTGVYCGQGNYRRPIAHTFLH